MSIDAIEYGVQAEKVVTTWFRVRCDDSPSGFIQISKTPPSGANAMTVTIKPLYGEAFTVNADVLRSAIDLALHARPADFDKAYREEHWRRKQIKRLTEGDKVEINDRGRCDSVRRGTVTRLDDYYAHITLDRRSEEEQAAHLERKVPREDIRTVFDREAA